MRSLADYFRSRPGRPYVRPWALATPIAVLLVCLPLLRPLRHPGQASVDEQLRLATISALVEHRPTIDASLAARLAIDTRSFPLRSHLISVNGQLYSDQPPMMAFLLSGPYWVMHALGYRLQDYSVLVPYLLTLLGVTLPAAGVAGLIYKMSRIFELPRPLRAALAAAAVFATGLISYAVVLNAHVPAAALVLAAAGCLIHLSGSKHPARGGGWLVIAGFCTALAATIDPGAIIYLLLLVVVVLALRLPIGLRIGGVLLYLLGAAAPILMHAALVVHLTGDLRPGMLHPELAARHQRLFPDELSASPDTYDADDVLANDDSVDPDQPAGPVGAWQTVTQALGRFGWTLIGEHGLLVHFPVMLLGLAGMLAVMHRHWPTMVKLLAAASAIAVLVGLIGFSLARYGPVTAAFGNRWLIVFLPLMFFWTGAWLRREHAGATWAAAAMLLVFSMAVSLVGATDPMPRGGYTHYTAGTALHNLLNPPSPISQTVLADQ